MKVIAWMLYTSLTLLVFGCVVDNPPLDWNDEVLNWSSYEIGVRELKTSGQNGIIILYSDWCPTCTEYSTLFKDSEVVQALDALVLIRVNIELEPEIAEIFSLDGEYVPRTFALDSSGRIIKSLNSQGT
ncbi:thioredoxin family protein [Microbulbifer bruguierae]|uniref:Thioredoxin family protein n=1 Tax=Microbulbifer bruguierae TaxID=3029061 RepID=A0ABY8NED2_9GAMM|nr:thioredoxin family protein [Microbulbifer bruguierae]WGL16962.1 thioredoxin family protein [Microbulbifer bruguierae]